MEGIERMFDIDSLEVELKVDQSVLEKLVKEAREEFPDDEMMVELHVVRALRRNRRKNLH